MCGGASPRRVAASISKVLRRGKPRREANSDGIAAVLDEKLLVNEVH
jgi:hypothetical protein